MRVRKEWCSARVQVPDITSEVEFPPLRLVKGESEQDGVKESRKRVSFGEVSVVGVKDEPKLKRMKKKGEKKEARAREKEEKRKRKLRDAEEDEMRSGRCKEDSKRERKSLLWKRMNDGKRETSSKPQWSDLVRQVRSIDINIDAVATARVS